MITTRNPVAGKIVADIPSVLGERGGEFVTAELFDPRDHP